MSSLVLLLSSALVGDFVQAAHADLRVAPNDTAAPRGRAPMGAKCVVYSSGKNGWSEVFCDLGKGAPENQAQGWVHTDVLGAKAPKIDAAVMAPAAVPPEQGVVALEVRGVDPEAKDRKRLERFPVNAANPRSYVMFETESFDILEVKVVTAGKSKTPIRLEQRTVKAVTLGVGVGAAPTIFGFKEQASEWTPMTSVGKNRYRIAEQQVPDVVFSKEDLTEELRQRGQERLIEQVNADDPTAPVAGAVAEVRIRVMAKTGDNWQEVHQVSVLVPCY